MAAMKRTIALTAVTLALLMPAAADAQVWTKVIPAGSNAAWRTQTIRATATVSVQVRVNGRTLRQELYDDSSQLALARRGRGVVVTFQFFHHRGPGRIEVANFRSRPLRLSVRVTQVIAAPMAGDGN